MAMTHERCEYYTNTNTPAYSERTTMMKINFDDIDTWKRRILYQYKHTSLLRKNNNDEEKSFMAMTHKRGI
jgi:hypothetical protein